MLFLPELLDYWGVGFVVLGDNVENFSTWHIFSTSLMWRNFRPDQTTILCHFASPLQIWFLWTQFCVNLAFQKRFLLLIIMPFLSDPLGADLTVVFIIFLIFIPCKPIIFKQPHSSDFSRATRISYIARKRTAPGFILRRQRQWQRHTQRQIRWQRQRHSRRKSSCIFAFVFVRVFVFFNVIPG